MKGRLVIVRWEQEPLESGWWAVKAEPEWVPVYEWVEEDDQ